MTDYIDLIFYGIASVLASILAYLFDFDRVIRKRIKSENLTPIKLVVENELALIEGEVSEQVETLTSPFSGKKCICYQIIICDSDQRKRRYFVKNRSIDFFIKDTTEEAHLRMWNYEASLQRDVIYDASKDILIPDRLSDFIKVNEIQLKDHMGRKQSLVFEEGIIEPGEKVYVKARGNWKETSYYDKKTLVMSGTNDEPLIISDRADILKT